MTLPDSSLVPTVGMPATVLYWTDRKAATVVEVGHYWLVVQMDKATRTDNNGMSEIQNYIYERDPRGLLITFKRDIKGRWRSACRNDKGNLVLDDRGYGLLLGYRRHYFDYSF